MTEHPTADDVPLTCPCSEPSSGCELTESNSATGPTNGEPTSTGTFWPAGSLSTTEKATVYIARGCAIIDATEAAYRTASADPFEAAIDGLADGDGLVGP